MDEYLCHGRQDAEDGEGKIIHFIVGDVSEEVWKVRKEKIVRVMIRGLDYKCNKEVFKGCLAQLFIL